MEVPAAAENNADETEPKLRGTESRVIFFSGFITTSDAFQIQVVVSFVNIKILIMASVYLSLVQTSVFMSKSLMKKNIPEFI